MSSLTSSELKSASYLSSFIFDVIKAKHLSRSVVRAALAACLAELDPEAHYDFRIRLDSGKSAHGFVRIVTSPCPDTVCSDTDNTPF